LDQFPPETRSNSNSSNRKTRRWRRQTVTRESNGLETTHLGQRPRHAERERDREREGGNSFLASDDKGAWLEAVGFLDKAGRHHWGPSTRFYHNHRHHRHHHHH